jgi:hypothetical protein
MTASPKTVSDYWPPVGSPVVVPAVVHNSVAHSPASPSAAEPIHWAVTIPSSSIVGPGPYAPSYVSGTHYCLSCVLGYFIVVGNFADAFVVVGSLLNG